MAAFQSATESPGFWSKARSGQCQFMVLRCRGWAKSTSSQGSGSQDLQQASAKGRSMGWHGAIIGWISGRLSPKERKPDREKAQQTYICIWHLSMPPVSVSPESGLVGCALPDSRATGILSILSHISDQIAETTLWDCRLEVGALSLKSRGHPLSSESRAPYGAPSSEWHAPDGWV